MIVSVIYSVVKCLVFIFNLICLVLGMALICTNALGLTTAPPGTDEHAYYIVGIILGSLVCMITILGCYGVVCEIIGVNSVYAFFILVLLVMQYLQLKSYEPAEYHKNALLRLDKAWRRLEIEAHLMATIESDYHCCALNSSRDYNYRGLITPSSCYTNRDITFIGNLYKHGCIKAMNQVHQIASIREFICNWCVILAESLVLVDIIILNIFVYFRHHRRRLNTEPVRGYVEARANHIGSRMPLISNEF